MAVFLLAFGLVISAAAEPLWSLVGPEAKLFSRVNKLRAERHLKKLRASPELAKVARAHAEDMMRNDYLSHRDRQGRNPLERVRAAGIEGFKLLAENIASSDVAEARVAAIVEEWLQSTLHRENLLNPAFNTSGLAVVESPDGHTLAVQLFATF